MTTLLLLPIWLLWLLIGAIAIAYRLPVALAEGDGIGIIILLGIGSGVTYALVHTYPLLMR